MDDDVVEMIKRERRKRDKLKNVGQTLHPEGLGAMKSRKWRLVVVMAKIQRGEVVHPSPSLPHKESIWEEHDRRHRGHQPTGFVHPYCRIVGAGGW